ncbi:MAG: DUF805 domain-containing protein [Proteobacteria bacterium]|nr:DUF805 domain-containing protein [Pseudomonadota bacterium]
MSSCFSKYATFSGRASRSEFWWFYLFFTLMSWAASIVGAVTLGIGMEAGAIALSTVLQTILLVPWLAVASRRMHDINKSGWWMLIMFTGIGVFFSSTGGLIRATMPKIASGIQSCRVSFSGFTLAFAGNLLDDKRLPAKSPVE